MLKQTGHRSGSVLTLVVLLAVFAFPALAQYHSADTTADQVIALSELLRVIQFFNSNGYHCEFGTEDNLAPGLGDTACSPHDSDFLPQDWYINLSELLRLIQFFNSSGYHTECGSEDDYAPGPGPLSDCTPDPETCLPETVFGQQPILTTETMTRVFSAGGTSYRVYDDFSGISEAIGKVQWWGFEDDGSPGPCIRTATDFVVSFFQNNAGQPGTVIYSESVNATREDTGLVYSFYWANFPLYRYTATLAAPVSVASGWFSVESIYAGNDCYFSVCNSFAGNLSGLLKTGSSYSPLAFDAAFCFAPASVKGEGEGNG